MHVRRPAILSSLLVLGALLAGCAAPAADTGRPPSDGTPAMPRVGAAVAFEAACHFKFCYEPNVAADQAGRIYATAALSDGISVSENGGVTWQKLAPPPLPLPRAPVGRLPDSFANDALLQTDATGRLYFSALVSTAVYGAFGFHQAISGVQVARSEDGGRSWPVNTFVSVASYPDSPTANTDRQWLAFGQGETVHLFHRHPQAGGVVSTSSDGGRTFGRSVTVLEGAEGGYIAGHPVADAAGRVYWPFFRFPSMAGVGTRALEVAISDDKGASWRMATVDRQHPGSFFPVLAAAPGGALHLAWRTIEDTIVVASSLDAGASWSAPVDWTMPGSKAAYASPWILATDERVDVAWFAGAASEEETEATLVLSRSVAGGPSTASSVALVRGSPLRPGNTDFAHAAMLPDGRVAVTYAHVDEPDRIHVVMADAPPG